MKRGMQDMRDAFVDFRDYFVKYSCNAGFQFKTRGAFSVHGKFKTCSTTVTFCNLLDKIKRVSATLCMSFCFSVTFKCTIQYVVRFYIF